MISIQITHRYRIFPGITPKQLLRLKANGQGVWPTQTVANNHLWIGAIHASLANVRTVPPI